MIKKGWRTVLKDSLIWAGLLTPLMLYGTTVLNRPDREEIANQLLFQGVIYSRRIKTHPHPQIVHILDIDLTAPGLKPFVTPGFDGVLSDRGEDLGQESLAQRTSSFLRAHQLQVAVNANFFYPFRERMLWDSIPKEGESANLLGVSISEGEVVSPPERGWPALCLSQQAEIHGEGDCPKGTEQAVAGNTLLLQNGQLTETLQDLLNGSDPDRPYPVNIAAIDSSGARLWLILSDGKQPLYSEGMTLQEVVDLLQELGAANAVRLDGGGSTTLAITTETSYSLLNSVIHAKVPGQERPVANHLGFFAEPLQP